MDGLATVLLLERPDFRRTYLAIAASELGDALQYIALMWFALEAGGPLGVLAVRLADSVPALVFGLHGGLAADRWSRRRIMVSADLVRGCVLVPVAVAALAGALPLWGLVFAAFLLATATSYFEPAYGAVLPALVDRRNVQQANALVQSTANAVGIGGWALAAGLLAFVPLTAFFAVNAASFFVSAALLVGVRERGRGEAEHGEFWARMTAGVGALRPRPVLAAAVVVLGLAVTVESGTWMVGVPTIVRDQLDLGAGGFSVVMVGYATGAIAAGAVLSRRPVRHKARASLLAWTLYLPGFLLMGFAGSLPVAAAGAVLAGVAQSSSLVLLNTAAQEDIPDAVLGRAMGLISLVHRGAHASGLLLVSPLFAAVEPSWVFVGAAVAAPLLGLGGLAVATTRGSEARGRGSARTLRS